MKRREFINTLGTGSLALSIGSCAQTTVVSDQSVQKKPNIVVIMADDLGYGDLTCLNKESKIPTPQIDRIAEEGIKFTDAHSPSAVCTPTRYGLLTGRYAWRTRLKSGVLWGYSPPLIDKERLTIASMLQEHGYETACVGKWHLGLDWTTTDGSVISDHTNESGENVDYDQPIKGGPNDLGFDYFFGIPASLDMDPYVYIENDMVTEKPSKYVERSPYPAYYRSGPIAPDFDFYEVLPTFTEKSIDFISRHQSTQPEKPFFLYLPLAAPHTPWVPNDYVKGESGAGVYGDFVVEVDQNVGRLLNHLEQLGIADDTLVIFTSDNGAHESHIGEHNNGVSTGEDNFGHEANYIYRGQKADVWDGGHRVPFLVRWPKNVTPMTESNQLIGLNDIMMTVADIVRHPMPENAAEDSYSFKPVLDNPTMTEPIRDHLIHHSLRGVFCIRQGPWKLIEKRGSGGFTAPQSIEPGPGEPAGQLYNMVEDPEEQNNLYLTHPDIVSQLKSRLEQIKSQGYSRDVKEYAL